MNKLYVSFLILVLCLCGCQKKISNDITSQSPFGINMTSYLDMTYDEVTSELQKQGITVSDSGNNVYQFSDSLMGQDCITLLCFAEYMDDELRLMYFRKEAKFEDLELSEAEQNALMEVYQLLCKDYGDPEDIYNQSGDVIPADKVAITDLINTVVNWGERYSNSKNEGPYVSLECFQIGEEPAYVAYSEYSSSADYSLK